MVNKVILLGNLGADPETRTTSGGSTVCNLRLATSERVKDGDGNWTERTEWHSVVVFGKTAEAVARYCAKGKTIYVEGRLQTRKWQDKTGADRYSTEVVAVDVRFVGGRGGGESDHERDERDDARRQPPVRNTGRTTTPPVPDDDIPF